MNKDCYRLIFSKAHGMLIAVAEFVVSKNKSRGRKSRRRNLPRSMEDQGIFARLGPLAIGVRATVVILLCPMIVFAQIVADPSAPSRQQPTVLTAANGVPVVNIQTPSSAGVSRNTYTRFDVDRQGAILNNSRTNVQTRLGGWVQGNSWLATGSARVILNEVNSSDPSQLRGYIEVGGSRAEVVIANPAGINVDGAGFINASRATLTTGTPIVNSGSLDAYRVQSGTINIAGAGLDTSTADYTDLIARAVAVNAGLWANTLGVTTGANQVDRANSAAAPISGTGTPPAYAIDVALLGGMYAGKITLVGTEAGLGVRNAGDIGAGAGEVVVT
ncbi:MAG: filamentous hemagglutinin N-terminal domain-containing protein, partial [Deltaproteobacteria bacterium]|nr:filamentous hemagglutinin N-terminal domain-containing protein [Deltaproteobacteria bacterium]